MRCPFCSNEDTQVKDSRSSDDASAIRRRRECSKCDERFTTFERVQLRELTVIKSDGTREQFQREKLLRSMRLCLQKRPVEDEIIGLNVNSIVRKLETSSDSDITSRKIGELAMEVISGLDPVAYVRYASVYKDFRAVDDFNTFLEDLEIKYKNNYQKADYY